MSALVLLFTLKLNMQLMWWYRLTLDFVKTSRQELYMANTVSKVALYLLLYNYELDYKGTKKRSGNVMDCHATARGSNPERNGVFIDLHVLRKGQ